jgi:hypothetical protein
MVGEIDAEFPKILFIGFVSTAAGREQFATDDPARNVSAGHHRNALSPFVRFAERFFS